MDSLKQWEALRLKAIATSKSTPAASIFGKAGKSGAVYRWGIAVATGTECSEQFELLSRLACGGTIGKKHESFDLVGAVEDFILSIETASAISVVEANQAVAWAAALPALCRELEPRFSWQLMTSLRQLHEAVISKNQTYSTTHLILGGELGLTLAWRMADVPSCLRLQKQSIAAITDWCDQFDIAIAEAIAGAVDTRAVFASLTRSLTLLRCTSNHKIKKVHTKAADLLATWVAAMTVRKGGSALSSATREDVADDIAEGGLLDHAVAMDIESLEPAIAAALGQTQTGGRLAWEVSLPETMWHDSDSKLAIMLPEWDVQKSRTHIDYSGEHVLIEIFAGRNKVIDGAWHSTIEIDGEEQRPTGTWSEICEYTDDDVHYIELEQPWTGGILLQRQVMHVREDRCIHLADAIVPDPDHAAPDSAALDNTGVGTDDFRSIRYMSRIPMAENIEADPEPETREVFLNDGRRSAMVLPISAGEWRVGPTAATLKTSEDGHLVFASEGKGRLYCPLWIDCSQRRFKRKRTWRQLTVVDNLRLCRNDEAVGYRIQVGSEQWMIYRTLGEPKTRSVLGKHLIADFFASRFDPTYGDHDAIVTVDDSEPGED
ncbi:hypothetical protein [Rubripirellula reticaptiva]|nr:hypothetical protein [Rubripirellula reticaptiva]